MSEMDNFQNVFYPVAGGNAVFNLIFDVPENVDMENKINMGLSSNNSTAVIRVLNILFILI
mgnify:CR=1 FL=1